jgi:hypothetical protein
MNISGVGGAGYNLNNVIITVIDSTHFTYPSPGSSEALTASGGQAASPDSQ